LAILETLFRSIPTNLPDYAGFRFRAQTSHRLRVSLLSGRQWRASGFEPAGNNLSKSQESQKNIARNFPLDGSN
jgi:hypothetical protein